MFIEFKHPPLFPSRCSGLKGGGEKRRMAEEKRIK